MLYIYVEEILNMQSKPESQNVIYLNYDGEVIQGGNAISNYFGWVWYANQYDIDGSEISNNTVSNIKVPPAVSGLDRLNIFKQLANKYDIFDVNITDERNVYEAASGFKTMAIITHKPTIIEYNELTLAQNKSENYPWPYSYRRLLRHRFANPNWPRGYYPFFSARGLAAPPSYLSETLGGYTKYLFIWTNQITTSGLETKLEIFQGYNDRFSSTTEIARTIAHEVGHKFGLLHDGELPNTVYYDGHNDWLPIMGSAKDEGKKLAQWSKGEYTAAVQVGTFGNLSAMLGNQQNDLVIIGSDLGFIKSPKESISKTEVRAKDYEKYETRANQNLCWEYMENLGVYTRVLSQEDVMSFNGLRRIEGMIGFPGDFEILKILLPKGTYQFKIDPVFQNPESMLDIDMSILNCHCHRPKEKYPVNCNSEDLPTRYPTDLSSENFQCISFDNCSVCLLFKLLIIRLFVSSLFVSLLSILSVSSSSLF